MRSYSFQEAVVFDLLNADLLSKAPVIFFADTRSNLSNAAIGYLSPFQGLASVWGIGL